MLTIFFTSQPVQNYVDARTSDTGRFARFFWSMLHQGIYLPPSQFEAWFVSLALEDEQLKQTVEAARVALEESANGEEKNHE
jgi:glutamate-1-semialdehyde 2,1-aminomutase